MSLKQVSSAESSGSYVQALGDLVFRPSSLTESLEFGAPLRSHYGFTHGYSPMNHGAWGKAPNECLKRWHDIRDAIEVNPDWFFQHPEAQGGILKRVRAMLAAEVNCDVDELVITSNNTTALSSVLNSFSWRKGDVILYFDQLAYPSNFNHLRWLVDSRPDLQLTLYPIQATWPISDDELVRQFEAAIAEVEVVGKKVRLALFDVIPRVPAVVLPWERLVQVCKRRSIFSMVDGAHAFGQVHLDLRSQAPDCFVTRISKWAYAPRATTFLYVPFRNQAGLHALPIGSDYDPSAAGQRSKTRWAHEWSFIASSDWSAAFTIPAALEFRKRLGGDERIRDYCHDLAVKGGQLVANILKTEMLDNSPDHSLTASITNVRLPLTCPTNSADRTRIVTKIQDELLDRSQTYVPVYAHDNKFYVRISCQVYNTLDDLRYLGQTLASICTNRIDAKL